MAPIFGYLTTVILWLPKMGVLQVCPGPPQLGSPWTRSMAVETKLGVEKPPPKRTASCSYGSSWGPPGDVSLERSTRLSSITQKESLVVRFTVAAVLRSFNHQIGNCGVHVTAPTEARHTAAAAEGMCALQRLLCSEATLERPGGPQEN